MRKRHFEDAKVALWECESAIITKPTNVIKSECRKKKNEIFIASVKVSTILFR